MFERFTTSARAAVEDARYEAARRGDRRIGTEHLLMALLQDDALARIVGADAAAAHQVADDLDRAALDAIGLTLGDFQPRGSTALGKRVPMTSAAKSVLAGALAKAAAEKARTLTARHLLLALFDLHEPDPAAELLTALPIDRARVRERLATAA